MSIEKQENGESKAHDVPKKPRKRISKATLWTIKITFITLILAIIVSFFTEITSGRSHIIVSFVVLALLIVVSIIFDAVAVAVTSCDVAPLLSMASRKVKGAKVAVKLVQNAEKVSNICGDVIGDMCGIISGSAAAAIIIKLAVDNPDMYIYSILMSSIIAAVTVGGKAFCKSFAIKKSKEIVMFTSKILGVFYRPKSK
jgi:CBS domain containing-hemolysin-like protein